MSLFGNSREVQFRTCDYGKPQASPIKQKRENSFIEEKEKFGGAVRNKKSIGGN